MDKEQETAKDQNTVYELGFHIVPLVAEEQLAAEVAGIKSMIEAHGGTFISEDFPKMRSLAYSITKKIDAKNHKFNTAYFGWVKFETTPAEAVKIKTELDANKNVLRFLLIKTVRENTLIGNRVMVAKGQRRVDGKTGETIEGAPVSVEEMDKSIDKLVIQ
jgi:ribosomal protein S6